jgi:hypothetical protein
MPFLLAALFMPANPIDLLRMLIVLLVLGPGFRDQFGGCERTKIWSRNIRAEGPGIAGPDVGLFALALRPKAVQNRLRKPGPGDRKHH